MKSAWWGRTTRMRMHTCRCSGLEAQADWIEAEGLTRDRAMLHEYAESDQVTVQYPDGRCVVYESR